MPHFEVRPYGSRNFAIYMNGELVAVTVYKKGANRVKELLESLCIAVPVSVLKLVAVSASITQPKQARAA